MARTIGARFTAMFTARRITGSLDHGLVDLEAHEVVPENRPAAAQLDSRHAAQAVDGEKRDILGHVRLPGLDRRQRVFASGMTRQITLSTCGDGSL
ncbi:MAG: hypothetical protein WDN49_03550 [Acetobacteraceae bacterium]